MHPRRLRADAPHRLGQRERPSARPRDRTRWTNVRATELLKEQHRQVEQLFKRALRAEDREERQRLCGDIATSLQQHTALEEKLTVLQELVDQHVDEEEGEMFPLAERVFGKERSEELAREMQRRMDAGHDGGEGRARGGEPEHERSHAR